MGIRFTPLAAMGQFNRFLGEDRVERCVKLALESVMREMINEIKDSSRAGRWQDQTGNLRDSIFQVVLDPRETKSTDTPDGSVSITNQEGGDIIIGVVVAGMEYAIFVELHPSLSVLQEVFNSWQPKLAKELNQRIKDCINGDKP